MEDAVEKFVSGRYDVNTKAVLQQKREHVLLLSSQQGGVAEGFLVACEWSLCTGRLPSVQQDCTALFSAIPQFWLFFAVMANTSLQARPIIGTVNCRKMRMDKMRPLNILDFSLIFETFNSYLKQIELLLGKLLNKIIFKIIFQ